MGDLNFDANTVDPSQAFDPMPPGWYSMVITGAELVEPKKGGANMLRLVHEIDEQKHPEHKGRQVWSYLNINHADVTTREIARKSLSAICHAINVMVPNLADLLGKRLEVKLSVRPAKDGYDASNDVRGYRATGGAAPAAAPAPKPAASAPKSSGWKR